MTRALMIFATALVAAGNWTADVAAYDQVHAEILRMSAMLSDGIVRQFSARF